MLISVKQIQPKVTRTSSTVIGMTTRLEQETEDISKRWLRPLTNLILKPQALRIDKI